MSSTKLQDNACTPKEEKRINLFKKGSIIVLSEFGMVYSLVIRQDKIDLMTEKGSVTLVEFSQIQKSKIFKKGKIRCPLDQRKIFELLNKEIKIHSFHF